MSKIKSKGLDLFLAEFLWTIFKGWPHRKKIASPGQPSIDRKLWDKLKNFVPMCGQIAKQAFFPEDTFVHAKGLRIAVGICRTALVKPWTLKNCELSAGKSGARNSFFSVSGGEDMACYQRKHPGNIFFCLDIRGVNLLDVGRWAPGN